MTTIRDEAIRLRSMGHRAVTEGVNLGYVEAMRKEVYIAADLLDAFHLAALALRDAYAGSDTTKEQAMAWIKFETMMYDPNG